MSWLARVRNAFRGERVSTDVGDVQPALIR
jgi:hypothetical protein